MKKLVSLLLALTFVLGISAIAYAEVELSGDARVRGIYHSNFDFNSDADTASKDERYWDQRVRVNATGKVGNAKVMTRFTLSEGVWNNAGDESVTASDVTGGNVILDDDDYAYIVVPVGDMVTIHAGRQLADWGNKFLVWNGGRDRLKFIIKPAAEHTIGLLTDKFSEVNDGQMDNDNDGYAALYIGNFGDWTAGVIVIYVNDKTGADDVNGTIVDGYFKGKISTVNVLGELAIKSGDKYETGTSEEAQVGGFIAASMGFDALTASAALAFAADDYTADKYFTPTLFFGTSQPSAIGNFGAGDDGSTVAFVAGIDYKASDAIGLGAKLAFASFDKHSFCANGEDQCSAFEIDGTFKYSLTEKTNYFVDLGFLFPSDFNANDDNAMTFVNRIETSF